MKRTLSLIILITTGVVVAGGGNYLIEYDFPVHGDDWYGQPGKNKPYLDYYSQTVITTQLGDDFCQGYESSLVNYAQGPELLRTQEKNTAYDFKYSATSTCTSTPPTKPDPIFKNGFE